MPRSEVHAQDLCEPIDACSNLKVEIVRDPHDNTSSGQLNLERLIFELEFELTGSLPITGANYADWDDPNWTYPTPINNTLSGGVSLCPPMVKGRIKTDIGDDVEAVDMTIGLESSSSSNCTLNGNCQPGSCSSSYDTETDINGYFGRCVCEDCNCYTVTPFKNDNPLNGITTFDLVLISKHILGIEPLGSPYKMIAADANKSNSITTFDIVEIRKLILGIYDTFPANTSWRFVEKNYIFPDTITFNPWDEVFPESIPNYNTSGSATADFIGIKIGDVNNTAVSHIRPMRRPLAPFSVTAPALAQSQTVTIPIVYQGLEPLEAFQFGMKWDTSVLRLISPSVGNVPYLDASCLNTSLPGQIRAVWLSLDPDYRISEGDVLFNLTFQVKQAANTLPLAFDDAVLYNAVWRSDDTECAVAISNAALRRDARQSYATLKASIHPNPGGSTAFLEVTALDKGKARILLFDAYGRRLLLRDVNLISGRQTVELPETGVLPPGVYSWQMVSGSTKSGGSWVKQ